ATDLHGAAIYAANLGTVLREQAEYERAIDATQEAARDLGRLGKQAERAITLFNYGNLLLSVGDLEGAGQAAEEATALADKVGDARARGYAHLLTGDRLRRQGELEGALAAYHAAAAALAGGSASDRVSATLNLAETLAELGQAGAARAALFDARALAAPANLL